MTYTNEPRQGAFHVKFSHDQGTALTLRPFELSDHDVLFNALESSATDLARFSPWALAPFDRSATLALLDHWREAWVSGSSYELGLFDESGALLAAVALGTATPNPRCLELSFWTPTPQAGRGNATLAARLAVLCAFQVWRAVRVQLSHDTANKPSQSIALKCGFQREGVCRGLTRLGFPSSSYQGAGDAVLYGLVAEDLEALPWKLAIAGRVQIAETEQAALEREREH